VKVPADRTGPHELISAYEDYQRERIYPIIQKLSWFALLVLLAFLPWDYSSDSPDRNLAMLFRVLSIVPLSLIGFAASNRWFEAHFVNAVLLLSLCSFSLLNQNFLLLEERTPYLFSVLFYFNLGFLMLAPLVSTAHIIANFFVPLALVYGAFSFYGKLDEYLLPFTLHGLPILVFLNVCVWYVRRSARHTFELYRRNLELATIDSLTGLNNRRSWEQLSSTLLAKARREKSSFAVLMLDIDLFKKVNDTRGHPAGDATLKAVAACLKAVLREYDILGRYGGEEFVVSVANLSIVQVMNLGERLRMAVEALEIDTGKGVPLQITISIGCAVSLEPQESLEQFLANSDAALYQSKQGGRNQVQLSQSPLTTAPAPC